MTVTFTCEVADVDLGKRWKCTSADGTKTWYTGESYRYDGKLASEVQQAEPEAEQPPLSVIPKPTEGFVKKGGWGANEDPDTWEVRRMKDDPRLWKVTDDKGKNVATHFTTEKNAQCYIEYYQAMEELEPNDDEKPPVEKPAPEPEPETGLTIKGPYPLSGKEYTTTTRRAVRHYASGKPDDETIEANAKEIKDRSHQFITYVTIHKMVHKDTMSQKIGGTHMGTGWFVNSIGTDDGLCGIGVEKDHPTTSHNDIKGGKIGNIVGKKIGMASVYFADQNKVELWTDTGDGKWVKQCEGVNVKGFNPKAKVFECQLRIDGFPKKSEPTIHYARAQAISSAATP